MAKTNSRVPKSLRKSDPMKTKTGKPRLSTLSVKDLETLKKTTKPKHMAMVNAEIVKRTATVSEITSLIMPTPVAALN